MADNQLDKEWQKKLTPQQFAVLRDKATEAPFSGKFLHNAKTGTYICAACGSPLFSSTTKFDSGTGWPSFYDVIQSGAVRLEIDTTLGMKRTEAVCATCGGHLGHVFDDAFDQPTGQRFCINSISLEFKPDSNVK